jgi:hypothetical protein
MIINNSALDEGAWGGGVSSQYGANPYFENVIISGNTANGGGGVFCKNSNPIFIQSEISDNISRGESHWDPGGGGMYLDDSNPILKNVLIHNNIAEYNDSTSSHPEYMYGNGGGIYVNGSSYPSLTNVTISGNTAVDGGGMYLSSASNSNIINTIIWNNSPESIYLYNVSSEPNITNSDIQDGWEGEGNIDTNPLFADPENGDYTLQVGSPCIDAGTFIEELDFCGSSPDMGAYEYITEGCEECSDNIEGDTNFDGSVNILDIIIIANCILSDNCDICFDLNGDQDLDILDIVILANIILDN